MVISLSFCLMVNVRKKSPYWGGLLVRNISNLELIFNPARRAASSLISKRTLWFSMTKLMMAPDVAKWSRLSVTVKTLSPFSA